MRFLAVSAICCVLSVPALAVELDFGGIETFAAANRTGFSSIDATYAEDGFLVDLVSDDLTFLPGAGSLAINDGSVTGLGDHFASAVIRADGGALFSLDAFDVSFAYSGFVAEYDSFGSTFLFQRIVAVGDDITLTGTKSDGSTVTASVSSAKNNPNVTNEFGLVPFGSPATFTAADFGADFTDLLSLEIAVGGQPSAFDPRNLDRADPFFSAFADCGLTDCSFTAADGSDVFISTLIDGLRNDASLVEFDSFSLTVGGSSDGSMTVPLPAPASALLLALGLLGAVGRRGRPAA